MLAPLAHSLGLPVYVRSAPADSIHPNRPGRLRSIAPTCLIDLLGAVNQTAFLFSVIRIIRVIRGPLRKSVKSVDLQFAFIRVHSWFISTTGSLVEAVNLNRLFEDV